MRAYSVLKSLSSRYSVSLLIISNYKEPPLSPAVAECCQLIATVPLNPLEKLQIAIRLMTCKIAYLLPLLSASRPMKWMFVTRRRLKAIARMFEGTHFDVIHIFRIYMAPYASLFINDSFSGICQLDLDDIESLTNERLATLFALNGDRSKAMAMASEARQYKTVEKDLLPRFDRIFVCSVLDKKRISDQYQCRDIDVIPNIVQIPEVVREEGKRVPFTFLFVGSLKYYPNIDGVTFFCRSILPLIRNKAEMEFRIKIVGSISKKDAMILSHVKEVTLTGWVKDVSPHYLASDCALVPIRAGGGLRIKVIEAFAYRLPVISTSIGAEGINALHKKHLLIADSPEAFAESCLRIMKDAALRAHLVENAFSQVRTCHNIGRLTETLCSRARIDNSSL